MTPAILALTNLVPRWLLALLLAGALLNGCHIAGQRDAARSERAVLTARAEKLRADTAEVARKDAAMVAENQFTHALNQQDIVNVYTRKISALESARRDDAVAAVGLRNTIANYVAPGRAEAPGDPDACKREQHRLDTLAELLAEGTELVDQGRQLVQRRDAEVGLLLPLIKNDRRLLAE